jgi:hypothetical protein
MERGWGDLITVVKYSKCGHVEKKLYLFWFTPEQNIDRLKEATKRWI